VDLHNVFEEVKMLAHDAVYDSKSFPVETSCLDIENKLEWHSISSDRHSLRLYYDDGFVIYYKDNRETMKQLTDKEISEIQEAERASSSLTPLVDSPQSELAIST
uniref:Ubiquitin carboxyl-terminal hydrolase 47 C-terminal domain-containing protein n=1 Tax=Amphimedon queenslandica TaxID=400682 RepID=A0A1X7T3W1_AMPQE